MSDLRFSQAERYAMGTLARHASTFELEAALYRDELVTGRARLTDMGAYDRRILLVTLQAALERIVALEQPAEDPTVGPLPPIVRTMLDGGPCWCVSDREVHVDWFHSLRCQAIRAIWRERS